jgi:hypothetical protein
MEGLMLITLYIVIALASAPLFLFAVTPTLIFCAAWVS